MEVLLKFMTNNNLLSLIILTLAVNEAIAQGEPQKATDDPQQGVLPTLTIHGQEKANIRPATTYESPISNLDFDPRVDAEACGVWVVEAHLRLTVAFDLLLRQDGDFLFQQLVTGF